MNQKARLASYIEAAIIMTNIVDPVGECGSCGERVDAWMRQHVNLYGQPIPTICVVEFKYLAAFFGPGVLEGSKEAARTLSCTYGLPFVGWVTGNVPNRRGSPHCRQIYRPWGPAEWD
ncbi:MAG TPA: hypothetical protein VLE72_03135 [Candidatus Saccharimonadales bacterium]|nr:hypothetical protein [Candidatus Saccharimonadales bacterium]